MKNVIAILAVLSLAAFAGQLAVSPEQISGTDDLLTYDNGTTHWLTWGGLYRGTWFNVQDFNPAASGISIEMAEVWFYHHASYPWDTSDFYFELWNGDASSPVAQLDQQMVTATNNAPIYINYAPEILAEANFWGLVNTEMSAGGWPSILTDWAGTGEYHSFMTDDFIIWEPYTAGELLCNYIIRITEGDWSLDNTTWGSLKATF